MSNRLTILTTFRKNIPNDDIRTMARVRCICGTEFDVILRSIQNGNTRSCGCLRSALARANLEKINRKTA